MCFHLLHCVNGCQTEQTTQHEIHHCVTLHASRRVTDTANERLYLTEVPIVV